MLLFLSLKASGTSLPNKLFLTLPDCLGQVPKEGIKTSLC